MWKLFMSRIFKKITILANNFWEWKIAYGFAKPKVALENLVSGGKKEMMIVIFLAKMYYKIYLYPQRRIKVLLGSFSE